MKKFILGIIGMLMLASGCNQNNDKSIDKFQFSYSIPTEGNSWVINSIDKNETLINEGGIKNWTDSNTKIRTYFKTERAGKINVGLLAKSLQSSRIKVTVDNKSENIEVEKSVFDTIPIGSFELEKPGYHFIELEGIEKSGNTFADVNSVLVGGEASNGKVWFVKDDFYWGRRGPSVHLNFQVPDNSGEVQYFYNEITVSEENDVLGSYFMANGFKQGYFGIQVNSPTERRVLFSVWSPYNTDNPNAIPDDQKIKLLKKGDGVYTGEFGNEGSGGQSYYKFMWKAGTTYKFLLKGEPTGNNFTDFTAWFFAPEIGEWKLIASFSRPKTNAYLGQLYSFLENFYTTTGNISRVGMFSNQWAYTTNNEWIELTKIKFTADATARKQSRMDYAGGVDEDRFYLKNCGFFNETTPIDSYFERQAKGEVPAVNFDELP